MIRVFSIFKSVQGESTFQGMPCGFVRLAGCPLQCSYCDTRAACESDGKSTEISEVVQSVASLRVPLVEVTGGEPLAQEGTPALLTVLADQYGQVLLETSGAFQIKDLDPRVRVIMDIKCPGSGMSDRFLFENLEDLNGFGHELKFVVSSREDFDWATSFCISHDLLNREILISPVHRILDPSKLASWLIESRLNLRLQLQLHKVIWPDAEEER